jgi:branched-chain amino acid transport system ATP-binding protein
MTALVLDDLEKSFGGLRVTAAVSLVVEPGERRLIIGPNGAGKTTLFILISGELHPDRGSIQLFGLEITGIPSRRRTHLGLARTYQIITLFPGETLLRNVTLSLLGRSRLRWNPLVRLGRQEALIARAALERVGLGHLADRRSGRPPMASGAGSRSRWPWRRARKSCCSTSPSPGSRSTSGAMYRILAAIPRDVTVVMIEHDMDVALDFAERITVLHFGQVIVEGTRAEVVADPRTKEIYLGE